MNNKNTQRGGFARQRGGFAVGLIIGLLIGLALALGVALYVTKVPIPFVNKVPQRTADQDAAEIQKNKNWDPNSPLYGKNPAKPGTAASGTVTPPPSVAAPRPGALPMPAVTGGVTPPPAAPRASAPAGVRDPAAILADKPAAPKITSSASGAAGGADPFSYFVQAGAYGRTEDAEAQRAKLAMLGLEGRLTEREQAGRTVYRVRLGPFERKGDAEAAKEKLAGAGVEAALVRVQR
ncbi:MAG: SPOR domain-containing protein [Pseudomonadota bacterium]